MWGGLVMNEVKPGNGKHRPMRRNLTGTKRRTIFGLDTHPRDVQINDRMYSSRLMYSFR